MEVNLSNLDLEYKRYLQIIRPYLGQLVNEEAIKLCQVWIQRLSSCNDKEKPMRNKYIFVLCYQLAKGILDEPFLKFPPEYELPSISEIADITSSSSNLVDFDDDDDNDKNTRVLFKNNRNIISESKGSNLDNTDSDKSAFTSLMFTPEDISSKATRKQNILCYTCPQMTNACAAEICSDLCSQAQDQDQYEYRANNLILRLREIKKQNILLHKEIMALKEESKGKTSCESLMKVHTATSAYFESESNDHIKAMRNKLQSAEEDRKNLIQTLDSLQEQLDNLHEIKNREIEELDARHKMEISKIKTNLRDENKIIYEKKVEELKNYYEGLIKDIKDGHAAEIIHLTKIQNEIVLSKDKIIQDRDKEIREKENEIIERTKQLVLVTARELEKKNEIREKENEIIERAKQLELKTARELEEKDKIILSKESEISTLKNKLEEEKANFHSIINKFLDKPVDDSTTENIKSRSQELEKRLIKMEKSKSKCMKAYEAKFANLQREKHLAECSLQLQLMRQRAQTVNEIADENQAELNAALDKLEAKYKEIIANVQSTAIERRLQDEITINSIVKAACACSLRNDINSNQFPGKSVTAQLTRDHSCDSEISGTIRPEMGSNNKSFEDNSTRGGYCLDGEKFGQLLEKVYIPQRDYDLLHKKKSSCE